MENDITNNLLKEMESSYLNGDFNQSKEALLKAKASLNDGLFHYNLGTLYAKNNELGAARYNLEKAKKLGFSYPGLDKNLSLTTKLIESTSAQSQLTLTSFMTNISVSYFLLFSVSVWLIICLFKKAKMLSIQSFIILSVFAFSPILIKKLYVDTNFKTAVNLKKIEIYEGPSDIYNVIKEVEEGHKLIIGKSFDEWILVEWPIEYAGWIKRNDIGYL